jgi:hypothetical protein
VPLAERGARSTVPTTVLTHETAARFVPVMVVTMEPPTPFRTSRCDVDRPR